ncbi:DUF2789 domain-containing protein [Marinobacter caseinilyticus]|uniref:DUF2789 domain-containing protein n=1 Tax=Marinobacter caseinilyticus TaxID=2692195 RepID=UPI00140845E7|nr:DUF2789 domain-containing protein [Marinobacter caseinilyticus]
MDTSNHTLTTLFEQLGLPAGDDDIRQFITAHSPLEPYVKLIDAPFWSESQSRFLREGIADDSDWAEIIDELDAQLRH